MFVSCSFTCNTISIKTMKVLLQNLLVHGASITMYPMQSPPIVHEVYEAHPDALVDKKKYLAQVGM